MCRCVGAIILVLTAVTTLAEVPGYLRTALTNLTLGVPSGWACTITTNRNDDIIVERYDPSRPTGEQWTLLERQGRTPTPAEREKYLQSRPPGSSVGAQANFKKSDIEPGSLTLLAEDDERADFQGAFRQESTGADKMLGHLDLYLTVNKRQPRIEKYRLVLKSPYSPVLWVKFNKLQVENSYAPADSIRPDLPSKHSSHFSGRMFLFPIEEKLVVTYSDYSRTP